MLSPAGLPVEASPQVSLRPFTTLRAGGPAEWLAIARTADELAQIAVYSQTGEVKTTYLGWGSNVLPSDAGVPGLVVINQARRIEIGKDGEVRVDAGCGYQELFLKSAQASLKGLEFAVGIPGTAGGALVSNAGAYRSCISEFLTEIEIVSDGLRQWVGPEFMQFDYRDSLLRRPNPPPIALIQLKLKLPKGNPKEIYDEAREYQRQRIAKQPPSASAGSFFKNVNDAVLAQTLDDLPGPLKVKGVIPAGFLMQRSGLMGTRIGGAMLSRRHANIVVNVGGASATEIRMLTEYAKRAVFDTFSVQLEEEVLFLGNWSGFEA